MGRAPCCDKANVKRGPWSPEEDATLKNYVQKHGTGGNWIALPHKAGLKRCGKSCRLRWLNYLRPDIKHGGFTEEEDNFICTLYRNMGSRWSVIASRLPGRTDNDVKNHWNTKLKKKLMGGQANLTANNQTHHQNPPSSPSPTTTQTMKTETYNCDGILSMEVDYGSQTIPSMDAGIGLNLDYQRLVSEPSMFPRPELVKPSDFIGSTNCYVVSPPQDISGTSSSSSSSLKLENSSSYISWSDYNIDNADDDFFIDLAFGPSTDPFFGYELENKMGEVAQNSAPNLSILANLWANADSKPQGLYQSLTYS